MTKVMEPGKWLDLRCSRCGETSIRRGLVRGVIECLPSDSRLGDGNAADMTGSSLFRNSPARRRRGLESLVRGLAGSAEGRRGVRCGDCLRRHPRYSGPPARARCRTGVCALSRGVAERLGRLCEGRHSRAARVEGGHRSVEGAEEVCPDVTAGPIWDTAERRDQATARRAGAAQGIVPTARKRQRATPRNELTTDLARPDNDLNLCSQRPKASSRHPKNRLATWSRHVAAPDRGWAASANQLAAERSDLAAQDPRRTARAEKIATSRNFLATSIVDPEPILQGSCAVHLSTQLHEGGHREQQTSR
jgi:hypothetical protein